MASSTAQDEAHQPWKIAAARHLGIPRAAIQQTHQVLSANTQRVLSNAVFEHLKSI